MTRAARAPRTCRWLLPALLGWAATGALAAEPPPPADLAAALARADALELDAYAETIALLAPFESRADPEVDARLAQARVNRALVGRPEAELEGADLRAEFALAERAAARGHGGALNLLYLLHGNGWGTPVDVPRAIDYLRRAVDAGDAGARANYAAMLYDGRPELARDRPQACRLFAGLMDEDGASTIAAYYLGLATMRGECGLDEDAAKGADLIGRAAEAGLHDAERDFGRIHEDGVGVEADLATALAWYGKAAAHGDAFSLWRIGIAFIEGEGGRAADPVEAVRWFRKAVDAGSPDAMVSMGVMHATGDGVAQDFAASLDFYQRAVVAGEAHALRNLAYMHLLGQGIAADPAMAWFLYRQGLALGNAPDAKLQAAIDAKLDEAGRRQGEERLEVWHQASGVPRLPLKSLLKDIR